MTAGQRLRIGGIRADGGATALEFALVAPMAILLIVGIMHVSMLMFTLANAFWACQLAARCAAIEKDSTCSTTAKITDYAESKIMSADMPTFTVTSPTPDCGQEVSAALTYSYYIPFAGTQNVTMNAKACYPSS